MNDKRSKWFVLEEGDLIHVVPQTDIAPHGYSKDGKEARLEGMNCPCNPKSERRNGKLLIVHNSFEDEKRIDEIIKKQFSVL